MVNSRRARAVREAAITGVVLVWGTWEVVIGGARVQPLTIIAGLVVSILTMRADEARGETPP